MASSLFQGDPQKATSYTTSTSETPKWMQDAIYNQIQWATNAAQRPYEAYTGQRVAGLSPLQQQAYQQTQANQGAWAPQLAEAAQGTMDLTGQSSGTQAAQPYYAQQGAALGGINYNQPGQTLDPYVRQALNTNALNVASPYIKKGLDASGVAAAQPYTNAAAGALGGINYDAAEQGLTPYLKQGLSSSGLAAAAPYLQQAAKSSVSGIGDYMNPYTQQVTDQIAKLGARNLTENLLPGVSDAFVRAGGFGGSRMGEFGARALRDTQESILGQQAQALQQGYGQALGASETDKARQAQLAGQAGQLGTAQQQALLSAGQDIASARQQATQQQLAGAGQYANLGQQAGGLTQAQQQAYMQAAQQVGGLTQAQQQALLSGGQALSGAQQQAIQNQLSGASQLGGMASGAGALASSDAARQQSALAQLAQMAQQGQAMHGIDTAALEAAGSGLQTQQQKLLDAQYQQWAQQQQYPQQQLDWLSTQVRGMQPSVPVYKSGSETNIGGTAGYQASPLAQMSQLYSLYKGFSQ